MAVATYKSSKETTNYARVSRLIVDVCADLLRKLLEKRLPLNQFKTNLQNFKSKIFENLNSKQKELLYPRNKIFNGSYDDFDISLLYRVLRTFGNLPPPTKGWGIPPVADDHSISANIERIRAVKNDSYSHYLKASISDSNFNSIWLEISRTVEEIETTMFPGSTYFKNAVDNLKSDPLDPDVEKMYIEKLTKLKEEEEELKRVKDKIEETHAYMIKHMKTTEKCKDEHMSPLQRNIKDNTEAMINTHRNDKTFFPTRGIDTAMQVLNKFGIVICEGMSGTGKTTNAKEIMKLKSDNNKDCIMVALDDVRKWDEVVNAKWNMIILLDDFLGLNDEAFELRNNNIWWEKIYSCIKYGNVQVVMTSCTNTLRRHWRHLQKNKLFKDKYIVNFSSESLKLSIEEKTEILKRHCEKNNIFFCNTNSEENMVSEDILDPNVTVYISEERLIAMAASEPAIGFLQACFLFTTDRKNTRRGVNFINYASEILVSEFTDWSSSNLRTDKVQCCMFAYMLLKNGRIQLEQIDRNVLDNLSDIFGLPTQIHSQELKQALEELKDKYVMQDRDSESYTFKHQSIREAVINSFGKNYTRTVLELCDLNLINELIRTENYVPKCGEIVLHIQPYLYSLLVKRILHDRPVCLCIPHPAMEDPIFLQCFMETVLSSYEYRIRIAKSCRDDFGIFVWACMYGRIHFIELLWEKSNPAFRDTGVLNYICFGMSSSCKTDELRLSLHTLSEGLNWACKEGKTETVKWLTEHVDQFDQEHIGKAFLFSCMENRLNVVEHLLENKKFHVGYSYIIDGLRQACINGHQDVFEYLVNSRKEIQPEHLSEAFTVSCAANQNSMVELIMKISKQKNFKQSVHVSQNLENVTNLHIAAFIGNHKLFMKLVEMGLSISDRTRQNLSVLQCAILGYKQAGMLCVTMSNFSQMKIPTLAKFCDSWRKQKFGSVSDYEKIIEYLFESDKVTLIDLDFRVDKIGNTLAHYCVLHNSTSLVNTIYRKYRLLLSVPNNNDILPIEFGLFLGRHDICKVLFSIGQGIAKSSSFKSLLREGRKHHMRTYSWDDRRKPGILHHVDEKHNNVVFGSETEYDSMTKTEYLNVDSG